MRKHLPTDHPAAFGVLSLILFLAVSSLPCAQELRTVLAACSSCILWTVWARPFAVREWVPIIILVSVAVTLRMAGGIGVGLFSCVLTGLAEEMLFCGVILSCVQRTGHTPKKAMLLTAVLFAFCHMTYIGSLGLTLARVAFAFPFSVCMLWLYRETGHLWVPVVAHAAFDGALLWFV